MLLIVKVKSRSMEREIVKEDRWDKCECTRTRSRMGRSAALAHPNWPTRAQRSTTQLTRYWSTEQPSYICISGGGDTDKRGTRQQLIISNASRSTTGSQFTVSHLSRISVCFFKRTDTITCVNLAFSFIKVRAGRRYMWSCCRNLVLWENESSEDDRDQETLKRRREEVRLRKSTSTTYARWIVLHQGNLRRWKPTSGGC